MFVFSTLAELFEGKVRPEVPESWKYVEEHDEEELKEREDKVYQRAWSPTREKWDCETILSKWKWKKDNSSILHI